MLIPIRKSYIKRIGRIFKPIIASFSGMKSPSDYLSVFIVSTHLHSRFIIEIIPITLGKRDFVFCDFKPAITIHFNVNAIVLEMKNVSEHV